MQKRVFVSYSSKDQAAADTIRAALEAAGIGCWIAPRDLMAGTQWGAGIVEAITACEAMLVVFSAAANDSPQIVRELELAVSNRRALIPIRIEDVAPTQDMQFFLGVSHWFNAYPAPLATYLPTIVASVNSVLTKAASPWNSFRRRLPKPQVMGVAGAVGAAVLAAVLAATLMRPPSFDSMKSPLRGRWQAEFTLENGAKTDCVLDVQQQGQATYSDSCPPPLMAASGSLASLKQGIWAPASFRQGKDDGTFLLQGGTAHGFAAAYRVRGGRLRTNDPRFGEVKWRKISSSKPMPSELAGIAPAKSDWPLKDLPGITQRAQKYVRAKWRADAVVMSIRVELAAPGAGGVDGIQTPEGPVQISYEFYSPSTQEGLSLRPTMPSLAMSSEGVIDRDPRDALPETFVDLPQAIASVRAQGMRGQRIEKAELDNWGRGTTYGFLRISGVAWVIDSALDERFATSGLP